MPSTRPTADVAASLAVLAEVRGGSEARRLRRLAETLLAGGPLDVATARVSSRLQRLLTIGEQTGATAELLRAEAACGAASVEDRRRTIGAVLIPSVLLTALLALFTLFATLHQMKGGLRDLFAEWGVEPPLSALMMTRIVELQPVFLATLVAWSALLGWLVIAPLVPGLAAIHARGLRLLPGFARVARHRLTERSLRYAAALMDAGQTPADAVSLAANLTRASLPKNEPIADDPAAARAAAVRRAASAVLLLDILLWWLAAAIFLLVAALFYLIAMVNIYPLMPFLKLLNSLS